MKSYEMMYILKPCDDDFVNQSVERVIKLISSNGGVVVKNEVWGYRMLAYPIKNYDQGIYVFIYFNIDENMLKEIARVLKNTESIIRYMIVERR